MNICKRVRLKSFNGTTSKPINQQIRDCDDYWKLIGFEGEVIADEQVYKKLFKSTDNLRVLVKFYCDIKEFGLASHNEMDNSNWNNSLWILTDDIEPIESDEYKNLSDFQVSDRQTFINFLDLLRQDFLNNPDCWENKTLPDFLEAISAYTKDIQGYYDNQKLNVNADQASWQTFADIFKGAKIYE